MSQKVYASYEEKFLKNVILFAKNDKETLYFDKLFEEAVPRELLFNFFMKGLIVKYEDAYYKPLYLEETIDEELEIGVYDGSKTYTFVSETPEPEPEPEEDALIEVIPTEPIFDDQTGIITIPDVEGVIYTIENEVLEPGAQEPIEVDATVTVVAEPDEGYKFESETVDEWDFIWTQ